MNLAKRIGKEHGFECAVDYACGRYDRKHGQKQDTLWYLLGYGSSTILYVRIRKRYGMDAARKYLDGWYDRLFKREMGDDTLWYLLGYYAMKG